tara:strand:+ start:10967 stop:11569 length:603 start_codon:yes stop_codon:yes gene_type:complete
MKTKTLSERAAERDEMNRSHEDPFYLFALNDEAKDRLTRYIEEIPDTEEYWIPEKIPGDSREDFRVCDVHPPRRGTDVELIGESILTRINFKQYQFDINTFEFQVLRYRPGGRFDWHCDYGVAPNKKVWRKLSMSVQLSDPEDYEGGELVIVDYYNKYCTIPAKKGACVVFDSRCPHKANPITKGVRYVLVGWASGPKLR